MSTKPGQSPREDTVGPKSSNMIYRKGQERRSSCETLNMGVILEFEQTYIMVPIAEEGLELGKDESGCFFFSSKHWTSDSGGIQEAERLTVSYICRTGSG